MPDDEQILMARIKSQWGADIATACAASTVPQAFIAALVANETGGNPTVTRFEVEVFHHLQDVRAGVAVHYGAMRLPELADLNDDALVLLATSRGLTQVMGYNAVYHQIDPLQLADPATCFNLTLHMLAEYAQHDGLDLAADFSDLFRCWNTGRPDGQTADPAYVPQGLARMALYQV